MNTQADILKSIVEMQETAISLCRQAADALQSGKEKEAVNYLSDLKGGAVCVKDALSKLAPVICRHSCHTVICENLLCSIEHFAHFRGKRDLERSLNVLEFEIMALLRDLKEDLYFWNFIYPDEKKMKDYYDGEFAVNHRNGYVKDGFRYEVSIVVVGYNKVDYTKQCIEYLLRNTDMKRLDCELITINNGSSDGTESFFESLPHTKKINFAMNSLSSMEMCMQNSAEGRYIVFLANDVIVSERWLENLLACIKTDVTIAAACPVTNYVSNLQSIPVDYKSIEEMQIFAREFNRSDPQKWEDRARLLPIAALLSSEKLNEIGWFDRYFYFGEFADDDFSLRCRRAGYRQVLCRDTFVHHFGSVTSGDAQVKSDSLGISRRLYLKKHGIDAWSHDFCHNPIIFSHLNLGSKGRVNILGIDSGIGSTPLQIKAALRQKGNADALVFNFTTDRRFLRDLNPPVSDFCSFGENICEIENAFPGIRFDYVYINETINSYDDFFRLLEILQKRMTENGQLILKEDNFYSIETLCAVFTGNQAYRNGLIKFHDMQTVQEKLSRHFRDFLCAYYTDASKQNADSVLPGDKRADFLNQCYKYLGINATSDYRDTLNCNCYFIIAGKKI